MRGRLLSMCSCREEFAPSENARSFSYSSPANVVWELTGECNAKCKHCYSAAGKPFKNELTTEEAKSVIDQLHSVGVFILGFSGGEPLLRNDCPELVSYASSKGIVVNVATNGLLITDNIIKKLKKNGLRHLSISIDGASPQVHDSFRQVSGLFEKAVQVVNLAKQNDLRVNLGFTPTLLNYKEASAMIDLAKHLGVFSLTMAEYVPTGRGSKEIDLSPIQWKKLMDFWIEKGKSMKNEPDIRWHNARSVLLRREHFEKNITGWGCSAGITTCKITADGYVTPCALLPIKVGNLRTEQFREIWQGSEVFQKIRNRNMRTGKCGRCNNRDVCGGCRAVAYAYTGDYLAEDPRCWYN